MSEDRRFEIKYSKSPKFKFHAATGVVGGPSPNGEIIANFFVEHKTIPDSIEVTIDDNGDSKDKIKERDPALSFRELQFGVVLRPDIALAVGNWLVNHANNVIDESQK